MSIFGVLLRYKVHGMKSYEKKGNAINLLYFESFDTSFKFLVITVIASKLQSSFVSELTSSN